MNIAQKADKLYEMFEWRTFKRPVYNDKGIEVEVKEGKRCVVKDGDSHDEAIHIVYEVVELKMATDCAYEYTMEALGYLSEIELDNWDDEDALDEAIMEMRDRFEPDVYTSGLTEWLDKSNYHVYYLSEILEEFKPSDGFELLRLAQARCFEEAFDKVVEEVKQLLED